MCVHIHTYKYTHTGRVGGEARQRKRECTREKVGDGGGEVERGGTWDWAVGVQSRSQAAETGRPARTFFFKKKFLRNAHSFCLHIWKHVCLQNVYVIVCVNVYMHTFVHI